MSQWTVSTHCHGTKSVPKQINNIHSVFYDVAVVPTILEPDDNITLTVVQFTTAMFHCSAASILPPVISWFRVFENGTTEELTADEDARISLSIPEVDLGYELENYGAVARVNRTLTLARAVSDDSGRYYCVTHNEVGMTTQEVQLLIQGEVQS